MSRFTARCVVVGAAVALVVVGVLAPLSGVGHGALLGAGACCALVDVVLHRSASALPADRPVVVVAPSIPDRVGAPGTPPDTSERLHVLQPPAALVPDADGGSPTLVLGHGPGDHVVRVDAASHVAVVGTGALALAVFRGLAEQLRAAAVHDGDDLRWAVAPGLLDAGGPTSDEPSPRTLPRGTSVAVWMDEGGRPLGTVVLVAGLGSVPRQRDVTVEVTRYGCSVRRSDDHDVVRVAPALPLLDLDPVGTG